MNNMSRPVYPFEVKSADVWMIALPASFAFITEPLAGIVGTTIIGRLGVPAALGGLALGALVFDVVYSLPYFLRIGTAGLTAQAVGARDPNDGLLPVARALVVAFLAGLALIVLSAPLLGLARLALAPGAEVGTVMADYVHVRIWSAPFALINFALLGWFYGRAKATTGLVLQIAIHGVNISTSLLLVYGLGWGVKGVALGSVLGDCTASGLGLYLMARHFGGVGALFGRIRWDELIDAVALRRMFDLSRDLTIRTLALMASFAYVAAAGARLGEITLAANAVLLNLIMVSAFFLDGLAQAVEQLCGKAVGANYRPAFHAALRLSLNWSFVLAGGFALFWLAAGPAIVALMTTSPEVREMAQSYLWLVALAALTGAPAFVFDGVLVGATLNVLMRNGMLLALAAFFAIALALQPRLGNLGLWLAINGFFLARAGVYWWGLRDKVGGLFRA